MGSGPHIEDTLTLHLGFPGLAGLSTTPTEGKEELPQARESEILTQGPKREEIEESAREAQLKPVRAAVEGWQWT